MEYRYGSHTVYSIEYHFVWVTKYRYKVLTGDVALRVRELVRQTCDRFEIQILQGVVSKDHVHIHIEYPPSLSISILVKKLKRSIKIFESSFMNENFRNLELITSINFFPQIFSKESGNYRKMG